MPRFGSLDELFELPPPALIVIGEVREVTMRRVEYPDGRLVTPDLILYRPDPALRLDRDTTYHEVRIESVVYAVPEHHVEAGGTIALRSQRIPGEEAVAHGVMREPEASSRRLLILLPAPHEAYETSRGWGALRLDGDVVRYDDAWRTRVRLDGAVYTPDALLAHLHTAAEERGSP